MLSVLALVISGVLTANDAQIPKSEQKGAKRELKTKKKEVKKEKKAVRKPRPVSN